MIFFCKDQYFRLEKYFFIFFAVVIFTSLLLSILKREGRIGTHGKPCCLKGYICQAAMKTAGR